MAPTRQPMMADAQRTPTGVRPDLTSRKHIHDLVVGFYRELIMDEVLGQIFEEVAEVDWSKHIPLLIDYWCRVLLGHQTYQGAILITYVINETERHHVEAQLGVVHTPERGPGRLYRVVRSHLHPGRPDRQRTARSSGPAHGSGRKVTCQSP